MFGDIHFSLASLQLSQPVEDGEKHKTQEGLSKMDEPIQDGVLIPGGPKFQTKERGVFAASVSGV